MYLTTEDVANLVRSREEAEQLIASLLTRFARESGESRLTTEVCFVKQTTQEVARRTASNLLTSFVARRYDAGW